MPEEVKEPQDNLTEQTNQLIQEKDAEMRLMLFIQTLMKINERERIVPYEQQSN